MPRLLTPEELTLDHAPRRRDDLTGVEVDGEIVLYEPDRGGVHRLDRVATVLWNCFDGSATVRDLRQDLADIFEEQPDRVGEDVLEYVRELGRQGLLQGILRTPEDEEDAG